MCYLLNFWTPAGCSCIFEQIWEWYQSYPTLSYRANISQRVKLLLQQDQRGFSTATVPEVVRIHWLSQGFFSGADVCGDVSQQVGPLSILSYWSSLTPDMWLRRECECGASSEEKAFLWITMTHPGSHKSNQNQVRDLIWSKSSHFRQSVPASPQLMRVKHFQSHLKQLLSSVQPNLNSPPGI